MGRGISRRERIRDEKRRTWSGGNGGRKDQKKKTYMVWTREKEKDYQMQHCMGM